MSPEMPEAGSPQMVMFVTVRQLLAATPFRPFRIVTTSGQSYVVATGDHGGFISAARIILVYNDEDGVVQIPALQISSVEPVSRRPRRKAA